MKFSLRITDNFMRNLETIEVFLLENDNTSHFFNILVDKLLNSVFDSLARFPRIGIDYLRKSPASLQAQNHLKLLQKRLKNIEVREYIFDEYLLLYALRERQLFLLSIKHHKQLAFDIDFKSLWV